MKLGGGVIKLLRIICKAGGLRCRDKKECNGWEWCVVRGEIVSECRSEFIYRRNSEGARRNSNSNREMEVDDADDATKGEAVGEEGEHDYWCQRREHFTVSPIIPQRAPLPWYIVYTRLCPKEYLNKWNRTGEERGSWMIIMLMPEGILSDAKKGRRVGMHDQWVVQERLHADALALFVSTAAATFSLLQWLESGESRQERLVFYLTKIIS